MMVVQSSTSASPRMNASIRSSSSRSFICPWATRTFTSGTSRSRSSAIAADRAARGCARRRPARRAAPRAGSPRASERLAPATRAWVRTASRSAGGVSITDRSRRPVKAICSVRGMGVAVSVNTSTVFLICLMRSLCATPKRCSSSTTSRPSAFADSMPLAAAGGASRSRRRPCRDARPFDDVARLGLGRAEARQRLDAHRVALEALARRSPQCCWHRAPSSARAPRPASRPSRRGRRRGWRPRSCRSRRRRRRAGPSASASACRPARPRWRRAGRASPRRGSWPRTPRSRRSRGGNAKPGASSRAACTASSSLGHVAQRLPDFAACALLPGLSAEADRCAAWAPSAPP